MNDDAIVGIDIAKQSFDVCLLLGSQRHERHFANTPHGFSKLTQFLAARGVSDLHACMEATGSYGDPLARYLYEQGMRVSVVNPYRIHAYAESLMQRTKTDKADARVIALFCQHQRPDAWQPPAPEVLELQAMLRHYAVLQENRQQHVNRLTETQQPEVVKRSLEAIIALLDEQITQLKKQITQHIDQYPKLREDRELLTSLPGIGELSAAKLLAEVVDFSRYSHARKVVGYSGICPSVRHSGSSQRSGGRVSKKGNPRIRKALYMCALAAMRCSPEIKAFAERLSSKGKKPKQVIVAVMRKLLTLAFGVLKSRRPYSPTFALDNH
jgi:transposase